MVAITEQLSHGISPRDALASRRPEVPTTPSQFTDKERTMILLIGSGHSLPQIAEEIHNAESTTHLYKTVINRKLGTHSDSGIAVAAMNADVVTPEEILARHPDAARLDPSRVESLAQREVDVLEPYAYRGLSGQQLKAELRLNDFELSLFFGGIFQKLGVEERITAAVLLRAYDKQKGIQRPKPKAVVPPPHRKIDPESLLASEEAIQAIMAENMLLVPEADEAPPES